MVVLDYASIVKKGVKSSSQARSEAQATPPNSRTKFRPDSSNSDSEGRSGLKVENEERSRSRGENVRESSRKQGAYYERVKTTIVAGNEHQSSVFGHVQSEEKDRAKPAPDNRDDIIHNDVKDSCARVAVCGNPAQVSLGSPTASKDSSSTGSSPVWRQSGNTNRQNAVSSGSRIVGAHPIGRPPPGASPNRHGRWRRQSGENTRAFSPQRSGSSGGDTQWRHGSGPRRSSGGRSGESTGRGKKKYKQRKQDEKYRPEVAEPDPVRREVPEPEPEAAKPVPPAVAAPPANHVNDAPIVEPRNDASPAPAVDENEKSQTDPVKEKNDRNNVTPDTEKPVPKIELRYAYKEDQWSPLNPEGKKQYDREFLLSFQLASCTKPDNLPDIPDVILNQSHTNEQHPKFMPKTPSFDFFTPNYVRSASSGSNRQGSGSANRRNSQPGGKGSRDMKPQRVIEIPNQPPVELHKAEASWTKQMKEKKKDVAEIPDEDRETEELFRKVRGILNKLTPQKFKILVTQIQKLEINTEKRLTGVIDLIFEKAIDEPNFAVPYALLCKTLGQTTVKSDHVGGKPVTFRVKLLARCQKEFEKDRDEELQLSKWQEQIETAETDEKKKELEEGLEEAKARSKRRSTGNIRFIGELFKLTMLTEKIMHQCLMKLLDSGTEEDLECLCRLFNTIGKGIDASEDARTRIDQYFKRMQEIIDHKHCSPRIRFLMLDVIDLRKNNWVNRRATNDPKTIDQIHKEAAAEKEREAMQEQQNRQNVNLNKPKGQQRGGPAAPRTGEDGWTTVQTKNQNVDMSRMKLTKQDTDNVQLGPVRLGSNSSWSRGSTGGSGSKPAEPENRTGMGMNRFTNLDARTRGTGRGMPAPGRPLDNRDNRGRTLQPMGPNKRPMGPRGSQESERESALAAVRLPSNNYRSISGAVAPRRGSLGGAGGGSRGNSRENSRSRDNSQNRDNYLQRSRDTSPRIVEPEQDRHASSPGPKQMDRDAMASKAKAILEEFLHLDDKKEALYCVSELKDQKLLNIFVEECINHVLERSESARKHTAFLLRDCIIQEYLPREAWVQGVQSVTELGEDFEIDIPKIWQYLAELIGPMMEDGLVPMNYLTGICLPIMTIRKRGRLAVAVLEYISHREGHGKAGSLWRRSGLKWSDIVDYQGVQLDEFVKDNKLEYTIEEGGAVLDESLSFEDIQKELSILFKRSARDEEIFDWVEGHVGEPRCKDPKFIRALMTEVCKSAITVSGGQKHEKTKLESRAHVLQKYIDHEPNLEVQALYALQALVHELEHPSGLLQSFFEELNDLEILSDDAFESWMNSEDPNEQKGFAVAKKSVNPFLSTLLADDDEVDES